MRPRILACGLALCALTATAAAQAPDYRPATGSELDARDALALTLFDETRIKSDELRSLNTLLLAYVQLDGSPRAMTKLVEKSIARRCRDACLRDAVRQHVRDAARMARSRSAPSGDIQRVRGRDPVTPTPPRKAKHRRSR